MTCETKTRVGTIVYMDKIEHCAPCLGSAHTISCDTMSCETICLETDVFNMFAYHRIELDKLLNQPNNNNIYGRYHANTYLGQKQREKETRHIRTIKMHTNTASQDIYTEKNAEVQSRCIPSQDIYTEKNAEVQSRCIPASKGYST